MLYFGNLNTELGLRWYTLKKKILILSRKIAKESLEKFLWSLIIYICIMISLSQWLQTMHVAELQKQWGYRREHQCTQYIYSSCQLYWDILSRISSLQEINQNLPSACAKLQLLWEKIPIHQPPSNDQNWVTPPVKPSTVNSMNFGSVTANILQQHYGGNFLFNQQVMKAPAQKYW